jgi:hypothetical protein
MQSFIIGGVENKHYLYVVLTWNKIKQINNVREIEYTPNNENNENMATLENCRKKIIQFGLIMIEKYMLQILIAD